MNKWLYTALTCFLALMAVSGLMQGIARLFMGVQVFTFESFVPYFVVVNAVSLITSALLLKYYHYRQYRFAFITGLIYTIINICYVAEIYRMLVSHTQAGYYLPLLFLSLTAGLAYAAALMFIRSERASWLRITGTYMLLTDVIVITTTITGLTHKIITPDSIYEKAAQWTTLAVCMIPVLFMIHILRESRRDTEMPVGKLSGLVLVIVWPLAVIFTIYTGTMLAMDCYNTSYWARHNFEKTKSLARLFEARTFVSGTGDTLFYQLLKPLDYDPSREYPLVVSLPYGGQPGTDKIRQIEGAAAAEVLSEDSCRKKYPAFLFIPNCPPGSGWGGIPGYPAVDSLVYDAIVSLDAQFSIDTTRRYVTGISRGGYGAWQFICMRPDLFAAAIPVCGGGNPALAARAAGVAVWAFHGSKDPNVPVSGTRNMISAIKNAGGHPLYTEYPEKGHNIWYEVSITPGLWDWLFAQQRK